MANTQCNDMSVGGGPFPIEIPTHSFTWHVENPNSRFGKWENGTTRGYSTVFVVVESKYYNNGTWLEQETRYWTSPRYVVAGNGERLGAKRGFLVGVVALSCLLGAVW